jgi:hypothetical protein
VEDLDAQPETPKGLSRREILKRSAIAGGVAWTAPMVIDSLASPAGAISGGINLNGGISYAIMVYCVGACNADGSNLRATLIDGTTCVGGNQGSNDTGGTITTSSTCHGFYFNYNVPGGDQNIKYSTNNSTFTSVPNGSCGNLFTASGNTVKADPSITLVMGLAHAGGCSGNNVGSNISKLSIVCAASNTVVFNC